MKNEIEISEKFQPLFELLQGNYSEVDTVILTGGRYSLKSYTVSIFANTAIYYFGWNILYTRFTNSTIIDSIKPEVSDKIELLGLDGKVKDTDTHIESNGNRIAFKGIKPGSKAQSANLKSLSGFNCFINDEAEELPDFKTFKKIFYSIRETNKRNLSILILNPTDKEHWIYKEFFEKKGLEGGENCIVDNVMYIHTSYLDASIDKIPPNILADYEKLKIEDPDEYDNVILGGWITEVDGLVLPKSSLKRYKDFPQNLEYFTIGAIDAADEGKDHFAFPVARVYGNRVYVYDAIFNNGANLDVYYPESVAFVKENKLSTTVVETNNFGAWFARKLREDLKGYFIFGQPAKGNKMGRILMNAGLVKMYFYFPEQPTPALQKFINQMTKLLKTSKDEDDAFDSLVMMAAYLEKYHGLFKDE